MRKKHLNYYSVRHGAMILSLAIAGTGISLSIHESKLDHLENPEYCVLCKLNPAHMADAINKDHRDKYYARYVEGQESYTETDTIIAEEIILDDGSVVYTAPAGYTLDGNVAHKTTFYPATTDRTEIRDKETHELVRIIK